MCTKFEKKILICFWVIASTRKFLRRRRRRRRDGPESNISPTFVWGYNYHVVPAVHSTPGHSQKRELSPRSAGCYYRNYKLKYVKGVSCVTQLSYVQPVTNVKNAAQNLPVGARFQNFWQTWLDLGAGPKVVQILKEGYTLPFWIQPKLTRSPTVISCYVNPHRNSYLQWN